MSTDTTQEVQILLIGPSYPFRGGIAHYSTLLYKELQQKYQVAFISFKTQYPAFLFPGKTDKDISGSPIQAQGVEYILSPFNPVTWIRTLRRIRYYRPRLIILQWWVVFWGPLFWMLSKIAKKLIKTKVLFICHNVFEHEDSSLKRLLARMFLSEGDYYIVHSDRDMKDLKRIIPDASAVKVFHPTYNVFNFDRIDAKEARKSLGLAGNVLLFFGFVRKYKGLKYLLEAMPEITKHIDLTLLVVGEFWHDKKEYLDIIKGLNIKNSVVIIDKYVPNEDIEMYFKACDVVVLPYVSGTGSGIAQIAMGFNKPVIATDAGCLPEIIDDGKTGYLVKPMDAGQIADAVIKCFSEGELAEFSENIKSGNQRFSWGHLVSEIGSLLSIEEGSGK